MELPAATAVVVRSEQWVNPRLCGRIAQIDGLRGIAILLVLVFHYFTAINAPAFPAWNALTAATRLFWSGVDLFFILSGFLITGILIGSRNSPTYFRTFYARRIHRIFPLYFGWLALFVAGVWLGIDGKFGTKLFASNVPLWLYPVFLQNNAPLWLNATLPGWMAMSWSLAVEEQFYLVLPAVARFIDKTLLLMLSGAVVALSPVYRFLLVSANPGLNSGWPFSTLMRLDGLAMGAAIAIVMRDERCWTWIERHAKWITAASFVLALVFAAMTWLNPGALAMAAWGFTIIDLLYASLLITAVLGLHSRVLESRLLLYFGRISYAVYIFHQGLRGIVNAVVPAFHPNAVRAIAVPLIALALTILLAEFSWRVMESKLIRRAHALYRY